MTSGTPQVGKNRYASVVFLLDMFLVPHVVDLTRLRALHTQMSRVEKYQFTRKLHPLPPCSFASACISKNIKKTPTVAHLSVPLQPINPYDSTLRRRYGEITYHECGSSRLSSYRHGICLSILLRIWWGILNTLAFHDCSLPFLPGGGKLSCDFTIP